MKNLIITTLLLLSLQANSQTLKPINSFLGINFGSSSAQVLIALKAKGGVFNKQNSNNDMLVFTGLSLGHRKVDILIVHLVDDKAFEAIFGFTPELEAKTIDEYNSLASDINEIYGKGKEFKKFKQPYEDGDGYELSAIKSGNAEYNTYWIDGDNSISEEITTHAGIRLTYQDGKLIKVAIERRKAKEKSDY